jgi:hypothetical protein
MTDVLFCDVSPATPCYCGNCDWRGSFDGTKIIHDFEERIDPGAEVPAGECPECGALAYIDTPETRARGAAEDLLAALEALQAWAATMGGWEAPCWQKADVAIAKAKEGK